MVTIPDSWQATLQEPSFLHLVTLFPDGRPHVTPVWVDYDEERNHVLVNTERGRRKERNVRNDPRVGGSLLDPEDPYRHLSFAGECVEITTEGAREHIDELARRYTGDDYANPIQTERVLLRIEADQVFVGP
jgi:PPOX class probable F420-dependent enzyme